MQYSIVRTLIGCMLVAQLFASQQIQGTQTTTSSKVAAFTTIGRTIGTVAIGTALALAAHIISDTLCTFAHEHGHAMIHRLYCWLHNIKNEWNVRLVRTGQLFFPYSGEFVSTFNNYNSCGNFFFLLFGPFVGLLTSYSSLLLVNCIDNTKSRQDILTAPIRIYGTIADNLTKLVTKRSLYGAPTVAGTFITVFTLLKSIRMLAEFQYGLTPMSVKTNMTGNLVIGDGIRIWQQLGLPYDLSVSFKTLSVTALVPLIASIGYGLCRGLYNLR